MDKEISYGAVVPARNREDWIGPHLELLLKYGVEPVVTIGNTPFDKGGGQEETEVDKTSIVLEKFFPKVKVLRGHMPNHKDVMNIGIRSLQHCDIIFVNDIDILLTDEDWKKTFHFIEVKYDLFDVFAIDFEKIMIEYYHDYRYGKPAMPGGAPPIIAIKDKVEMKHMTQASVDKKIVWDDKNVKFHHFRFCKKNGSGKQFYNEPKPHTHNMNDFTQAPAEIVRIIKKWQRRLKML